MLLICFSALTLLRHIFQPLVIKRGHERQKPFEALALYAVAPGISVQGHEADRRFPAERSILTIKAKNLPCPQVEGVPRFRFRSGWRLFNGALQPFFAGVRLDEFLDPFLLFGRLPTYLPAEGAAEFFAASVTNSTWRLPTRPAHQ